MRNQRGDSGQAAIEFALGLPIAVIAALAIAQVAILVRDQLAVELAARDAARRASVTTDVRAAAANPTPQVSGITVTIAESSATVTATATKDAVGQLPIVGLLVARVQPTASVTMLVEPP